MSVDYFHTVLSLLFANFYLRSDLRIEYARSKARVAHWSEEKLFLQEEMRRTLAFFRWKAASWNALSDACRLTSQDTARGAKAYALRQESQLIRLGRQFATTWKPILEANCLETSWVNEMDSYALPKTPYKSNFHYSLPGNSMATRPELHTSNGGFGNLSTGDPSLRPVLDDDGLDDIARADYDLGDVVYEDDTMYDDLGI